MFSWFGFVLGSLRDLMCNTNEEDMCFVSLSEHSSKPIFYTIFRSRKTGDAGIRISGVVFPIQLQKRAHSIAYQNSAWIYGVRAPRPFLEALSMKCPTLPEPHSHIPCRFQ